MGILELSFAAEIHRNTRMKKTNLDGKDIQNQRKPEMHTLEDRRTTQ